MATSGNIRQWICPILLYSLAVIILPAYSQTVERVCFDRVAEERRVECGRPTISEAECLSTEGCCWDSSTSGIIWCYRKQYPSCPSIPTASRTDCGTSGMTAVACHDRNCCWDRTIPGIPWCFHDQPDTCEIVPPGIRLDCGFPTITQTQCEGNTTISPECCWLPSPGLGVADCFFPMGTAFNVNPICSSLTFDGTSPLCFPSDPVISQSLCIYHQCCWVTTGDTSRCYEAVELTTTETPTTTPTTTIITTPDVCTVSPRRDCGQPGIGAATCTTGGICCWDPSGGVIQCYFDDTVPTTITDPSVCPTIDANTGEVCAADSNPFISEMKCYALGCCWDPNSVASGSNCYNPPDVCTVSGPRRDCGRPGIGVDVCTRGGICCFDPSGGVTQCYFKDTIPDPIEDPSVCPTIDANTGEVCATDSDPLISEMKCYALGCCWDPSSTASGSNCYNPPDPTTTTETPTTTEATTTEAMTTEEPTTTARTGVPDTPDMPVIEVTSDLTGLDSTNIAPPDGVVYKVTWWMDGRSVQTSIVDSPDDDAILMLNSVSLTSNPEMIVCVQARYDGSTDYTDPVCSDPYRVVQAIIDDPLFVNGIIVKEGYRVDVPFRIVGIPGEICSPTASYQLELQVVVDGDLEVSCGPDGVAFINQGASLIDDGSPTGTCSSVINPGPYISVSGTFALFGVIDNRVYDTTNITIRLQIKKVANSGTNSFGSCTVDVGIFNVVVVDKSPGAQACKVRYPFSIQRFDYSSISSNLINVFTLLRHQVLPFEIHIMTKAVRLSGSEYDIAALCGVAVRTGSSVIVISRCGGPPGGLAPTPVEVRAYLPDGVLNEGSYVYRNRQGGYTVVIQHGGQLTVSYGDVGPDGFFSLIYSPSPLDLGEVEGLCGEYQGPIQAGAPPAIDHAAGNSIVHQYRVNPSLNIFAQAGPNGPPGPKDWCSCLDLIYGTSCYATPYDRCDLSLTPIAPRLIDASTPEGAELITQWTDDANTAPVGPLITFVPPNPYTFDTATAICEQKILYTALGRLCQPLIPYSYQTAVQVCVNLIGRTGSDTGVALIVEGLKSECIQVTGNFIEIPDYLEDIFNYVCPNDCGGYGYCDNARCICRTGFTGTDCEQPPDAPPMLTGVKGGGLCIPDGTDNCGRITIYGTFNPSLTYICSLQFVCPLARENLWGEVTYPASNVQRSDITCPVPGGQSAIITVKDSRGRASAKSLPYIVYDPACLKCTIRNTYNYNCLLVGRGCYIMKRCFIPNSPHPRDICRYCDPAQNNTGWTRKEGENCALPVPVLLESVTDVSSTTFLLLVCLSVFLGLLFIIICACMCHRATTICRQVNGMEGDRYSSDQALAYGSVAGGSVCSGSQKRPWGVYALRDQWNYGHSHNH